MIHSQAAKDVIMVLPQSIGTTQVTGRIDSRNADWVTIKYIGDTAAAGDVLTVLKIGYGDTTSAFTDMTTAVGGGTGGFTIPAPNTSTGDVIKFEIDKVKYPYRYFQISITGDATARLTSVLGTLSRNKINPDTDSEAGCTEVVYC